MSGLAKAVLTLPNFKELTPEHLKLSVEEKLELSKQYLTSLVEVPVTAQDAVNFLDHLDAKDTALSEAFSVLSHLNAVESSDELRAVYEALLPELTAYYTAQSQNKILFELLQIIQNDTTVWQSLARDRKASIEHSLRDFRLMGIDLPENQQKRLGEIESRLSQLASEFSNHVLDATSQWFYPVTEQQLAGLPDYVIDLLKQNAKRFSSEQKSYDYVAGLDMPSYLGMMMFAEDRALREIIYKGYQTRCADTADEKYQAFNNTAIIQEILTLRQEKANLLGLRHYADLSIQTKMADNPEKVIDFLMDLGKTSKPFADKELAELTEFAKQDGIDTLQAWDVPYYSEKLKQHAYAISESAYKPYFPLNKVLQGLFGLVQKLYGIEIVEKQFDSYLDDVKYYEIIENGEVIAGFIFDLFARSTKRGGAWMGGFRSKSGLLEQNQLPIAFMVCNFNPPSEGEPAQLTHTQIQTLFHEFGHGMHYLLTEANVPSVAGTHGVAWDAVELPSQIMEFWIWDKDVLKQMSEHVQTGEALPDEMIDKLIKAKHYQTGMQMVRQLEFGLVDLNIHLQAPPNNIDMNSYLDQQIKKVRDVVSVLQPPAYQKFLHSFGHIFAGGYSAGYYSYKWAEVLASDAFDRFDEAGLFNAEVGQAFRKSVLAVGGSVSAMEAFVAFRGREPKVDALLKHSGFEVQSA